MEWAHDIVCTYGKIWKNNKSLLKKWNSQKICMLKIKFEMTIYLLILLQSCP